MVLADRRADQMQRQLHRSTDHGSLLCEERPLDCFEYASVVQQSSSYHDDARTWRRVKRLLRQNGYALGSLTSCFASFSLFDFGRLKPPWIRVKNV